MSNWIDVNDMLPPDFEEVLYCVKTDAKMDILTGHRENGVWFNCYMIYCSDPLNEKTVKVTHWMPLPEYPEDLLKEFKEEMICQKLTNQKTT